MYEPKPAPMDAAALPGYVSDELQSVARSQSDPVDFKQFNVLHVAPTKPRAGLVVCADGTNWNPGAGAGLYLYMTSWTKL